MLRLPLRHGTGIFHGSAAVPGWALRCPRRAGLWQISQQRGQCSSEKAKPPTCSKSVPPSLSLGSLAFWSSKPTWGRAGINTFRCLVGCTLGDFSAMWFLQSCYPEIGIGAIMAISSMFNIECIVNDSNISQWRAALPRQCYWRQFFYGWAETICPGLTRRERQQA